MSYRDRTSRTERTKSQREKLCKRLDLLFDARGVKNVHAVEHFQEKYGFKIDPGTITHWRNGRSWPNLDIFDLLCDFLEIDPGWFWSEDEVPEACHV